MYKINKHNKSGVRNQVNKVGCNGQLCMYVIPLLPILPFPIASIILPFKDVVQWVKSTSGYCSCLSRQVHVL